MTAFATHCAGARRLPAAAGPTCTIRMTVDATSVTALRQLAMRVCGDALEYMRIAVCGAGARMQVWLCVRLPIAALLRETLARQLPGVQVGPSRAWPDAR
ncbi:MAG: hypothetical protein ACREWI_05570 [Telluria sp.]